MSEHKAIPQKIRLRVYEKYDHRCAYCGCELEYKEMQVDHLNPVYKNTDIKHTMTDAEMYDISNLMPSCKQCNLYKSTFSLEEFRARLKDTMWKNLRMNFNYRLAVKYGFIKENDKPINSISKKEKINEQRNNIRLS